MQLASPADPVRSRPEPGSASRPSVREWGEALGFSSDELCARDGTLLRVTHGGRPDGPVVVLLHGAPQFSYCWRRVMATLGDRYRVVAPDLRGYGASELSRSGRYDLDVLVDDLGLVVDRFAPGAAVLLGAHDWGGPIAWRYAERHPWRVRHLVAANAPHPAAYALELPRPSQLIRSWYVFLFQVPRIERPIEATHASLLLWMMRASAPRHLFSADDLALYRAALDRPDRIAAVLAYYRAAMAGGLLERRRRELTSPRVQAAVTVVWGDTDKCLAPTHPDAIRRWAAHLEIRRLPTASHWLPEEHPDAIVQALVDGDASA